VIGTAFVKIRGENMCNYDSVMLERLATLAHDSEDHSQSGPRIET
jgi:hypothetical protein